MKTLIIIIIIIIIIIEKDNCGFSDDSFYLSPGSKMCHW